MDLLRFAGEAPDLLLEPGPGPEQLHRHAGDRTAQDRSRLRGAQPLEAAENDDLPVRRRDPVESEPEDRREVPLFRERRGILERLFEIETRLAAAAPGTELVAALVGA